VTEKLGRRVRCRHKPCALPTYLDPRLPRGDVQLAVSPGDELAVGDSTVA
jgi:hypothetical protein